jgi:hypothetical protein
MDIYKFGFYFFGLFVNLLCLLCYIMLCNVILIRLLEKILVKTLYYLILFVLPM